MQPQDTTTTSVPTTKRCSKCGEEKPLSAFQPDKAYRLGVRGECRQCETIRAREWRKKNPERFRATQNASRAANRERYRERNREFYAKHADEMRARAKRIKAAKPEQVIAHNAINNRVNDGRLEPASEHLCFICGIGKWENPDVVMHWHHPDYSKPLEVFPICGSCHKKLHPTKKE